MGPIDITVPMRAGMVHHPCVPPFEYTQIFDMNNGQDANLRKYCFGSHCGTHFDPPYHQVADGKKGDEIPADFFIGKARVFSFMSGSEIQADDVAGLDIEKGDIVLLKTPNSALMLKDEYTKNYVSVSKQAAQILVGKGIRAIGIDYLSVDKDGCNDTHHVFLGAGVPILEGIYLENVKPGTYKMTAMFMSIKDSDGAPLRAILEEYAQ